MKVALMSYHKNLYDLYPQKWIDEYRDSVLDQTYKDFDIFEVNYGNDDNRIFDNSTFIKKEFPTFVHVQNYLLELLFEKGYDCVANSNVDDKYSVCWIEKMLPYVERGYDLISCNFLLFQDLELLKKHYFDKLNIEQELANNHNIICHPSAMYSRKFFENGNRYIPEQIPLEDMMLWQRAIKNSKFIILPEHLCYHRIHDNSVCQSNNR